MKTLADSQLQIKFWLDDNTYDNTYNIQIS